MTQKDFPQEAVNAEVTYYRTYSRRKEDGTLEDFQQDTVPRSVNGLRRIGSPNQEQLEDMESLMKDLKVLPSGRWMWVGGTEWIEIPENYPGAFNCTAFSIDNLPIFGKLMDLAAMGCGTGSILEEKFISQLPTVKSSMEVNVSGEYGRIAKEERKNQTFINYVNTQDVHYFTIEVGDSRQGWSVAYQTLIDLAHSVPPNGESHYKIEVNVDNVRPKGEKLKKFGGTANPHKLKELFPRVAEVLNGAVGRQLNAEECTLIIDEAARVIVAGNLRRSASIKQYDADQPLLKLGLWQQDKEGNWNIDPKREALQMSNHTRVWHCKPSYEEIRDAVQKQVECGEGAIQYAPEAIARGNADLLDTSEKKQEFINRYCEDSSSARSYLSSLAEEGRDMDHSMNRYLLNPCFTEDTLIYTKEGSFPIKDLVSRTVEVWDGEQFVKVDNFRVTAENQEIYRVSLTNQEEVYATGYHKFVLADGTEKLLLDLEEGDSLLTLNPSDNIYVTEVEYSHVAEKVYCCTVPTNNRLALTVGIITGNCSEIIGKDLMCNLSEVHTNRLDPDNEEEQLRAVKAAGTWVSVLLERGFTDPVFQKSREEDPIVGASLTGLFDFFVYKFGVDWLRWWLADRRRDWHPEKVDIETMSPQTKEDWFLSNEEALGQFFLEEEKELLDYWRLTVKETVEEYCKERGLKTPNRTTCQKPSGTQSLLTNASPGWHPPKAIHYIRRITVGAQEPIGLAALDAGFNVVPGQADTDENGKLLHDPFDERVQTWLIEIPTRVSWADLPGIVEEGIDPFNFSAVAQYDFYMVCQQNWAEHNISSTIELDHNEVEPLAEQIYNSIQNDEGYISTALLQRFDPRNSTFPRLPFEPISKSEYDKLVQEVKDNKKVESLKEALDKYDLNNQTLAGPSGCDSDKCLF